MIKEPGRNLCSSASMHQSNVDQASPVPPAPGGAPTTKAGASRPRRSVQPLRSADRPFAALVSGLPYRPYGAGRHRTRHRRPRPCLEGRYVMIEPRPPHSARSGLPVAHRRVPRAGEPVPLPPSEANRRLRPGTRHHSGHNTLPTGRPIRSRSGWSPSGTPSARACDHDPGDPAKQSP
jgi:hypothetical protein